MCPARPCRFPMMADFDVFRDERHVLEHAETLLGDGNSVRDLRTELEWLADAYRKLLTISRRLVRLSDRNEERLKEANTRIRKQQRKLENELQFAKNVQMSMVPGNGHASICKPRFQLFAYLNPAHTVGGDFYYYQLEGRLLHFILGDVSDKGVPAALFMAKTITLYNSSLGEELAPGEIFSRMNDALCAGNDACMFVTALCGCLDLDNGSLVMSNAGHMAPVLHAERSHGTLDVDGSTALGLLEGIEYPSTEINLRKPGRVLMYSDGITEAINPAGYQYQEERLLELCRQSDAASAAVLGKVVLEDLDRFVDLAEQSDDITLLVLQIES